MPPAKLFRCSPKISLENNSEKCKPKNSSLNSSLHQYISNKIWGMQIHLLNQGALDEEAQLCVHICIVYTAYNVASSL